MPNYIQNKEHIDQGIQRNAVFPSHNKEYSNIYDIEAECAEFDDMAHEIVLAHCYSRMVPRYVKDTLEDEHGVRVVREHRVKIWHVLCCPTVQVVKPRE